MKTTIKNIISYFLSTAMLTLKSINTKKKRIILALVILFFSFALYPFNTQYYKDRSVNNTILVNTTEHYVRYINTAAQIAIPLILWDKVGIAQAILVAGTTAVSTHTLKHIFNNVTIFDTRLGLRPKGSDYNMPSGHSSMASSAMFFVIYRYGIIHAVYLLPITALTMYARVMLKSHTISAVFAGCILGIIAAFVFSTRRKKLTIK